MAPKSIKKMEERRQLLLRKKLQLLRLLLLEENLKVKKNKYKKRLWVRQLYQDRNAKGEFYNLVKDLQLYDQELFFQYFRMSPTDVETLLSWIAPRIMKQAAQMREPISPAERLCVLICSNHNCFKFLNESICCGLDYC